jgi:aryl-alcohol dehydrogenase-like predicted oxidoreductase
MGPCDESSSRVLLGKGLEITRVITGLWQVRNPIRFCRGTGQACLGGGRGDMQVADAEKDGAQVDRETAADVMEAFMRQGLDCFDAADHYGSAEDIVGVVVNRG